MTQPFCFPSLGLSNANTLWAYSLALFILEWCVSNFPVTSCKTVKYPGPWNLIPKDVDLIFLGKDLETWNVMAQILTSLALAGEIYTHIHSDSWSYLYLKNSKIKIKKNKKLKKETKNQGVLLAHLTLTSISCHDGAYKQTSSLSG